MSDDELKFYLAALRTGTVEEALKWLLRFSQLNLETLWPGQLDDLRYEVGVFSLYGQYAPFLHMPAGLKEAKQMEVWVPELSDMKKAQNLVRAWFQKRWLEKDDLKPVYLDAHTAKLTFRLIINTFSESAILKAKGQSYEDTFMFYSLSLLATFVHKLRRCIECKTIYFIERRTQQFCSVQCLRRVTQRRFQSRKRQRKAK